ncbi:MAG: hypothetical protein EAZ91_23250 [Cytophagales bacterium]|nr:MAG: hypothetical protein EAZ91_23250 [Cytophagales bacterium]
MIHFLRGSDSPQPSCIPPTHRLRLWLFFLLLLTLNQLAQAQTCTTPTVSLVNTGPGNCVGVASLSVSSNQPISQLSWYSGNTLVYTSNPQASTGTIVVGTGTSGSAANQLNFPYSVQLDATGAVYVGDGINFRVQKFPLNSTAGTAGTTVAGGNGEGNAANQLGPPVSVFVDGNGAIYIADVNNRRIQKWAAGGAGLPATSGTTVAGGSRGAAANQLENPYGVFVDGNGAVYIADAGNNRVQKWTAGATSGTTVAGNGVAGNAANQLNAPSAVFVDGSGALYVVDQGNHRIQKWAAGGASGTTVAGGNGLGTGAHQLYTPQGLFVDGNGTIYVADYGNHRVQKWTAGATTGITVAGGNGQANGANQLDRPYGVFVDGSGVVYVADYGNHRINKWAPGAVNPVYAPTAGGSYTVLVTSVNGCTAITNAVTVTGLPSVSISATPSQTIPVGSGVTLTASGAASYTWNNGQPGSTANPLVVSNVNSNTAFSVTGVTDGCSGTATITITTCAPPTVNLLNTGLGSCVGLASLSLSSNQSISQLSWYNGSTLVFSTSPQDNAGTTVAGGTDGPAANQLFYPVGVQVDAGGAVYVVDQGNNRIQKFPPNGTAGINGTTVAGGNGDGPDANQLSSPTGLFVDANGAIYVADQGNHRIQKFLPNSTSETAGITVAGGNGPGSGPDQFENPTGVHVDVGGAIYVSDGYNNRVQKWAAGATSGTTVAGGNGAGPDANQLETPYGLFVDASGAVYVADQYNNRIQKWAAGAVSGITVAGGNGAGDAADQLSNPTNVDVDASGAVYVADELNHRIQKWAPGGTSGITVAGGNGDGPAANQLNDPLDVYVDASGTLYVADQDNVRIQKWVPVSSTVYSPTAVGSYTVRVTSTNTCTAVTNAFTVTGPPSVSISPASQTITSGSGVTLTASGATSYTWSNGSTANPLILSNVTSTTTLSVTGTTGGCSGTATSSVSVTQASGAASLSVTNISAVVLSAGNCPASVTFDGRGQLFQVIGPAGSNYDQMISRRSLANYTGLKANLIKTTGIYTIRAMDSTRNLVRQFTFQVTGTSCP